MCMCICFRQPVKFTPSLECLGGLVSFQSFIYVFFVCAEVKLWSWFFVVKTSSTLGSASAFVILHSECLIQWHFLSLVVINSYLLTKVTITFNQFQEHGQVYHLNLFSIKKNTFESVLMRWMKLEPIIWSEVSQKGKHQYSILTHIYGI